MTDQFDDDDDTVGYGRPPKNHRFKPGQSGNPKGRPKGNKNLLTVVADELGRIVTITENGHQVKISMGALGVRQTVNKWVKGDIRAGAQLLPQWNAIDQKDAASDIGQPTLGDADRAVLNTLMSRMPKPDAGDEDAS